MQFYSEMIIKVKVYSIAKTATCLSFLRTQGITLTANKVMHYLHQSLNVCSGFAAADNKSTTRPPLPPPGCGGERKEKGRNWWVRIRAV